MAVRSRALVRAFGGLEAHAPGGDRLSVAGRGRVSSRRRLAAILAACHDGASHLGRQELPANETRTAAVWTVRHLGFVDECFRRRRIREGAGCAQLGKGGLRKR
jgi:hypothetical protein